MNTIRLRPYRHRNRTLSIHQVECAEELLKCPHETKDPNQTRQIIRLWLYL